MEIEFVDELPGRTRSDNQSAEMQEFAEALRANPGKWAMWPLSDEGHPSYQWVADAKRALKKPFRPTEHYEFASRQKRAWVRYIGPDTNTPTQEGTA
jgi:hypothetical protein